MPNAAGACTRVCRWSSQTSSRTPCHQSCRSRPPHMRIATAVPAARPPLPRRRIIDVRQRRHARLEALALVVTTLVVMAGSWITYDRQVSSLSQTAGGLARGEVVQVGSADAASLAAALT